MLSMNHVPIGVAAQVSENPAVRRRIEVHDFSLDSK
jgi:hypothetical protein